jgi:hypothetical protein
MELKDVAITSFEFSPGLKGPEVRALAKFAFDQADKPQFIWVDLKPEEQRALISVARAIEQRFLTKETPIPQKAKPSIGFHPLGPDTSD